MSISTYAFPQPPISIVGPSGQPLIFYHPLPSRVTVLKSIISNLSRSSPSASSASIPRQFQSFDSVIFDMNGVLLNWDRLGTFPGAALLRQTLKHPLWRSFEVGSITRADCVAAIGSALGVPSSEVDEAITAGVRSMHVCEPMLAAVKSISSSHKLYLMTNTPLSFLSQLSYLYNYEDFETNGLFTSGEVGLRKPDRAFYELVVEKTGVKPERTLFVDDTEENVEAAREVGFYSLLCKDIEQTAREVKTLCGTVGQCNQS